MANILAVDDSASDADLVYDDRSVDMARVVGPAQNPCTTNMLVARSRPIVVAGPWPG